MLLITKRIMDLVKNVTKLVKLVLKENPPTVLLVLNQDTYKITNVLRDVKMELLHIKQLPSVNLVTKNVKLVVVPNQTVVLLVINLLI